MGLDSGLYCKCERLPKKLWTYCRDDEFEISYFRKQWFLRNYIFSSIISPDDEQIDGAYIVTPSQVVAIAYSIRKILKDKELFKWAYVSDGWIYGGNPTKMKRDYRRTANRMDAFVRYIRRHDIDWEIFWVDSY